MRASQLTQSLTLAGLLVTSISHARIHKINIFDKSGKDPRVKQPLTGEGKKYASVGRVIAKQAVPWPDKSGKLVPTENLAGSGFMISPCLFFTNHHAVFGKSKEPNTRDFSVTFISTKKAVGRPIAWGPIAQTGLPGDDWALVELESNNCLGLETGWMVPGFFNVNDLKKKEFKIAGYPSDMNEDTSTTNLYISKKVQAHSIGSGIYADTIFMDGAGSGGTSGGPVFYEDGDGTPNYVGIYVAAVKNSGRILRRYEIAYANIAIDAVSILGKGDNFNLMMADIRKHGSPINRTSSH